MKTEKIITNNNMDATREKVYLAALLHDIGKFYQRADTGSVGSSTHLKDYS
ncbi:MAG: HD domain-containing protein, partial [Paludibacteraceae bacterium]|nr:HD domain-containing protein [Paludibacteraceae bacterium]